MSGHFLDLSGQRIMNRRRRPGNLRNGRTLRQWFSSSSYPHRATRVCEEIPRRIYAFGSAEPETNNLRKVADPENLKLIWETFLDSGSRRDRFNIPMGQRMAIVRNLSCAICSGEYRPGRCRTIFIPKANGQQRHLEVPSVPDLVATKAFAEALKPALWDCLPRHFGPKAGYLHLLATIKAMAEERGCFFLGDDDIANCYPTIPRAEAHQAFCGMVEPLGLTTTQSDADEISQFARTLIFGFEGQTRPVGLGQGSCYSPLAAAMFLKEFLDVPLEQNIGNAVNLLRYVDNTFVIGHEHCGVRTAMLDIQRILRRKGMNLKEAGTRVIDLRRNTEMSIFGFSVRWGRNGLTYHTTDETRERIRLRLTEGLTGRTREQTKKTVYGLIMGLLPAIAHAQGSLTQWLLQILAHEGYLHIPRTRIEHWVHKAARKWEQRVQECKLALIPRSITTTEENPPAS